jgi:hypothetical protein
MKTTKETKPKYHKWYTENGDWENPIRAYDCEHCFQILDYTYTVCGFKQINTHSDNMYMNDPFNCIDCEKCPKISGKEMERREKTLENKKVWLKDNMDLIQEDIK